MDINLEFHSSDHMRYENGLHVSGPHNGGAPRKFRVEPIINQVDCYLISLFNLETGNPVGQMVPKQMKLISKDNSKVILRGYGTDSFGTNYSNYGLTILYVKKIVAKIILHYIDRKVTIEYLP